MRAHSCEITASIFGSPDSTSTGEFNLLPPARHDTGNAVDGKSVGGIGSPHDTALTVRRPLPNTIALARADALFVELTGPARELLSAAIAAFRAALDRQDPAPIEAARADLLNVVDRLQARV